RETFSGVARPLAAPLRSPPARSRSRRVDHHCGSDRATPPRHHRLATSFIKPRPIRRNRPMKIPPYLGRALLGLFVGWPLLFQLLLIGWLFSAVLTADIIGKAGGIISGVLVALIFLFLCARGGWKTAARYSDATS